MPQDSGAFPLPESALEQIAAKACKEALADATVYTHSSTQGWNNQVINSMIEALVTETTSAADGTNPYKFVVNSTIIQNTAGGPGSAKRGMNSSVGAFWNSSRDGMWSYKYDQGESLGMDVVLSVIWVALDSKDGKS